MSDERVKEPRDERVKEPRDERVKEGGARLGESIDRARLGEELGKQ